MARLGRAQPFKPLVRPFVAAGSDVTVALTGVGATGAAGSFGSTRDVALTGVGATGAVGTFGAGPTVGLTGVGATGHVGSFGTLRGLETRQVAIVRLRESPFLFDERRWMRFSSFILDLETGLGLTSRTETD